MSKVSRSHMSKPLAKHQGSAVQSRSQGVVQLKTCKMVFDDRKFAGKYVFRLSEQQRDSLATIEKKITDVVGESTSHAISTSDEFGIQIKCNGPAGIPKGYYDLDVKVSSWILDGKSGISYKVEKYNKVTGDPSPPKEQVWLGAF